MSRVFQAFGRLLDGKDVKFLCVCKVNGTGGRVMEVLIPCGCVEDGGSSGMRGGESVIGNG